MTFLSLRSVCPGQISEDSRLRRWHIVAVAEVKRDLHIFQSGVRSVRKWEDGIWVTDHFRWPVFYYIRTYLSGGEGRTGAPVLQRKPDDSDQYLDTVLL